PGEEVRSDLQYPRRQRLRGDGVGRGRVRGQPRADRARAPVAPAKRGHRRADREERDRIELAAPAVCNQRFTMALSDRQIERYSRQIIVPAFGGHGQERLLAATLALSGELADLEAPLAYFVGAGVGTVLVEAAAGAPVESRMIHD